MDIVQKYPDSQVHSSISTDDLHTAHDTSHDLLDDSEEEEEDEANKTDVVDNDEDSSV